eukprot:TRINITY_DN30429_c0_g2_i1.p1 TRINITY_DN30429_c0_g2~~TRINITY_DN30429_c0_g2_i1.p1  ORF type:complete len:199 (-),score=22.68 TRINITY_DN30429_c0_g2_i1:280-876(-)
MGSMCDKGGAMGKDRFRLRRVKRASWMGLGLLTFSNMCQLFVCGFIIKEYNVCGCKRAFRGSRLATTAAVNCYRGMAKVLVVLGPLASVIMGLLYHWMVESLNMEGGLLMSSNVKFLLSWPDYSIWPARGVLLFACLGCFQALFAILIGHKLLRRAKSIVGDLIHDLNTVQEIELNAPYATPAQGPRSMAPKVKLPSR